MLASEESVEKSEYPMSHTELPSSPVDWTNVLVCPSNIQLQSQISLSCNHSFAVGQWRVGLLEHSAGLQKSHRATLVYVGPHYVEVPFSAWACAIPPLMALVFVAFVFYLWLLGGKGHRSRTATLPAGRTAVGQANESVKP